MSLTPVSGTTATEATLENLLEQVIADGPGGDSQLIAADLAEECERPYLAECLRWMHRHKKWPGPTRHDWWKNNISVPECCRLPAGNYSPNTIFRRAWAAGGQSVRKSLMALWDDWEEARISGWVPESL